ncbi:Uncharacterised protein [uncultured archaeon]|nr:Uncharacterised protein [uncultured archaeon]
MEVSEKRLLIAIFAVFLLGILFSIVNGLYTEETGEPIPLIVYGLAALSLGVGAFLVLLFQWRISQAQMLHVLKALPSDERKILEVLVKEKRIEQSYLVAMTGLSKVRVSRTLSRLEGRGILEKKQLGNTNLVVLKI